MSTDTACFLGPEGTFTHAGASQLVSDLDLTLEPFSTSASVIEAVDQGVCRYGVIPIENSVEGEVTANLDDIVFRFENIQVLREATVPITFVLAGLPGAVPESIRVVHSHPHALAQCRNVIAAAGWKTDLAASTVAGCEKVQNLKDPAVAAICPPDAARRYGLTVLRARIEDRTDARTRMWLLGSKRDAGPNVSARPTAPAKTTLAFTPRYNGPGVLNHILQALADGGFDLTSLTSRPTKTALGSYTFILTILADIADPDFRNSLMKAADVTASGVKFLGTYPSADEVVQSSPDAVIAAPVGSLRGVDLDVWLSRQ